MVSHLQNLYNIGCIIYSQHVNSFRCFVCSRHTRSYSVRNIACIRTTNTICIQISLRQYPFVQFSICFQKCICFFTCSRFCKSKFSSFTCKGKCIFISSRTGIIPHFLFVRNLKQQRVDVSFRTAGNSCTIPNQTVLFCIGTRSRKINLPTSIVVQKHTVSICQCV